LLAGRLFSCPTKYYFQQLSQHPIYSFTHTHTVIMMWCDNEMQSWNQSMNVLMFDIVEHNLITIKNIWSVQLDHQSLMLFEIEIEIE
jgi:hypothetical protein